MSIQFIVNNAHPSDELEVESWQDAWLVLYDCKHCVENMNKLDQYNLYAACIDVVCCHVFQRIIWTPNSFQYPLKGTCELWRERLADLIKRL